MRRWAIGRIWRGDRMAQKKPPRLLLNPDHIELVRNLLSSEDAGELLFAVCDYALHGVIPSRAEKAWLACFRLFQGEIDKDVARYAEKCERNRLNVQARWNRDANECSGVPIDTTVCDRIRPDTKDTQYNASQNNTSTTQFLVEFSDASPVKRKRFVPPTVDEVCAYCVERKNGTDAQAFVDHYAASGWMRGKTQIRDWKACVRTWEKNCRNTPVTVTGGANSFADFYDRF